MYFSLAIACISIVLVILKEIKVYQIVVLRYYVCWIIWSDFTKNIIWMKTDIIVVDESVQK